MVLYETFKQIYQRACQRKGGEQTLLTMLSQPLPPEKIASLSDADILSALTKAIFQAGFNWQQINDKWPHFEVAFLNFDLAELQHKDELWYARLQQNTQIVRNSKKILAVKQNVKLIADLSEKYGSSAVFIANWPGDEIIGLWQYLKQHGSRLGGITGARALRTLGKDTFILSPDVEGYLAEHQIITGNIASQSNQQKAQSFFNELKAQSNFSLQALSQLVALSYEGDG
ncbi:DNA-3-methyladenine glycosylase [Thalassotalea insulae]|uniref:DNA-3-methyladenine glycosylase n=1 Tax=Thalassotalea insulae TaxID=2056778 RepID=A0ABQ6GVM8_9GAMM|nr:DNA-3-methyladenine glycosylase I [Thalassotalea insulae]GLX79932.1 DNA-3-methyladenine glycosylase [Thalassotalea insulae]